MILYSIISLVITITITITITNTTAFPFNSGPIGEGAMSEDGWEGDI
jgi:hypothetical protein